MASVDPKYLAFYREARKDAKTLNNETIMKKLRAYIRLLDKYPQNGYIRLGITALKNELRDRGILDRKG